MSKLRYTATAKKYLKRFNTNTLFKVFIFSILVLIKEIKVLEY